MRAKVRSNIGFYVGDICYVLSDDVYYGVWGDVYEYQDCVAKDPKTGKRFAVAGTAWGDGCYNDDEGREYAVDAGVIGIVPLELAAKKTDGGQYFMGAGEAVFSSANGYFDVVLPSGEHVEIDTN